MYLDQIQYDLLRRWCPLYMTIVGKNTDNFYNRSHSDLVKTKHRCKYHFRNSLAWMEKRYKNNYHLNIYY